MMKPRFVMRKLMLFVCFVSAVFDAESQNLTIEGSAPDVYITHIVAPKENFYSVGRLYNQAPKAIAALNKITMEKGLTIGQHVKIPLNAQNFEGSGNAVAGETLIPLTHIVAKNENLFKIGSKFNVSAASIRQWNSLSSDNITSSRPLIVGYLKMQGSAGLAKTGNASPAKTAETLTQKETLPQSKKEVAEKKEAVEKKEDQVAEKKEIPEKKEAQVFEKKEVAEPKKKDPFASVSSVAPAKKETAEDTTPKNENVAKPVLKEERIEVVPPAKPEEAKQVNTSENKKADISSISAASSSAEGVFAGLYDHESTQKALSAKSGEAATFKSTSGWQDKKYYVLMNDVTPGTILKISSTENKFVYAKVLGSMPEMKENTGLLLRISNAAASYLGIFDPKFPVQVSFYQ